HLPVVCRSRHVRRKDAARDPDFSVLGKLESRRQNSRDGKTLIRQRQVQRAQITVAPVQPLPEAVADNRGSALIVPGSLEQAAHQRPYRESIEEAADTA